jgi:hypothetical protein
MIEMMLAESVVEPEVTPEERARKILTKGAPMAAQSVVWLSKYAAQESVRLSAAKYIVDGVVGGGFKSNSVEDDTLIALLSRLEDNDQRVEIGMQHPEF